MMFVSCSGDDEPDAITLKVSEKTLYKGNEYLIEATSNNDINYSSKNEFHATVSPEGLVEAQFVGETDILLSNSLGKKTFKVKVKPRYNLYPELKVKFGDTRKSVIAKLGRPDYEDSEGMGYEDYSNAVVALIFLFDSSNKVKGYGLMIKPSYFDDLVEFIDERYMFLGVDDDDIYLFANGLNLNTTTMLVSLSTYERSYYQITYMPYSSSQNAPLNSAKSFLSANKFDKWFQQLQ